MGILGSERRPRSLLSHCSAGDLSNGQCGSEKQTHKAGHFNLVHRITEQTNTLTQKMKIWPEAGIRCQLSLHYGSNPVLVFKSSSLSHMGRRDFLFSDTWGSWGKNLIFFLKQFQAKPSKQISSSRGAWRNNVFTSLALSFNLALLSEQSDFFWLTGLN